MSRLLRPKCCGDHSANPKCMCACFAAEAKRLTLLMGVCLKVHTTPSELLGELHACVTQSSMPVLAFIQHDEQAAWLHTADQ